MSKIAILTDSSCDIPQEMAEKYGIDIMSFHILLDDVDYVERVDCTNTEFYDKMRAAKGVPSTAAITPIQFCEKYCQYVDEGYTDVIHVPINKSGSSTYNNALMAQGMLREERPEHHLNIHLLDPHTYSMVFGWYLCEMARKLQNGAEIRHVIHEFEQQMNCMEVVLGPYSLRQMKKSGRISAAAAVMGELMGIRPIITLIDGKTKVEAKVRGDEKVVPAMVELCQKRAGDVEDFEYMIGHTKIPQAADLEKACRKATPEVKTIWNGRRCALAIFSGNSIFILRFRKACGLFETSFLPEGSKPNPTSVPNSAIIHCNPPKIMIYSLVLCFFTAPSEQLRILGSPAPLERRWAKPTGAGGSCAVKIKPLEYYHESEFFRP